MPELWHPQVQLYQVSDSIRENYSDISTPTGFPENPSEAVLG